MTFRVYLYMMPGNITSSILSYAPTYHFSSVVGQNENLIVAIHPWMELCKKGCIRMGCECHYGAMTGLGIAQTTERYHVESLLGVRAVLLEF